MPWERVSGAELSRHHLQHVTAGPGLSGVRGEPLLCSTPRYTFIHALPSARSAARRSARVAGCSAATPQFRLLGGRGAPWELRSSVLLWGSVSPSLGSLQQGLGLSLLFGEGSARSEPSLVQVGWAKCGHEHGLHVQRAVHVTKVPSTYLVLSEAFPL